MHLVLNTNTEATSLFFDLVSQRDDRVRIVAYDQDADKTKYTDRFVDLRANHKRPFELRFPIMPKEMMVRVYGKTGDSSLKLSSVEKKKLIPCDLWLYQDAREFIKFAKDFCVQASYLPEGTYKSKSGAYKIVYVNSIRDKNTGQAMGTPARIGHVSGIIEVNRVMFAEYTVPMRMIILLHEFSHKWMNQRNSGRSIDDESAADVNGLFMYLAMKFPHIDARLVFTNVFYKTKSAANVRRLNIIEEYITKWEQGKIVGSCN